MAEDKNANPVAPATTKKRRGISNETRSTTQKKFHERDCAKNYLFIAHLEDVQVNWSENDEGIKSPRMTFHFASGHKNEDERRHYYKSLWPVESSVDTIPNGKDEWKVNALFGFIKHFLDVLYLRGREMTEAEEDALTLPFEDFDENGYYVPVAAQDVFNGYAVLFENVAAMLNGSFGLAEGEIAKPCYKTANGQPVQLWLKLLRCTKRKGEWRNVEADGELGLPNFIGSGIIELFNETTKVPRVLTIDLSKESILPQKVKEAKTPTVGGAAPMGVAPMPGAMGAMPINDGAYTEAGEEMPF